MQELKKRILILIPRMGGGGAERVVSIIANNICGEYDIRIHTLVSNESFYNLDSRVTFASACYKIDRSTKRSRLFSMGRNFISSIVYVRRVIKEYKPHIILSFLEEMDIVCFFATKGLNGFKRINTERSDPNERNKKLQNFLHKIYKSSDALVCQTKTVAQYYSEVPVVEIIPNPIDLNICPQSVFEEGSTRIVGVGRLHKGKNFVMLEKAFAMIADQFPNATVTIYGEGPERESLAIEVKNDHLDDRVFLPGESKDILNEIKDAAIFAFPTNYEGFPNALVEAIAMGIPVVTTDFATGLAREIVNEDVGIVVPVGNTEQFAEGLRELLSDKNKRSRIHNCSREKVKQFSTEIVIDMWKQLFNEMIKE